MWTDTLVCGVRTYKGATETRVISTETTTATLTQTYVPVETETTTRAEGVAFIPCTCRECFGGIYRGTQPIERVHARGSDIACVRNSTRPHRFIF